MSDVPPPHPSDALLSHRLSKLEQESLLRPRQSDEHQRCEHAASALGVPLINLCSNDYLGFAGHPLSSTPTSPMPAGGAGASRLIHGTSAEHRRLERALSNWLGTEDALLFSSGYAANVGTLSALPAPEDVVLSDALNHASLIDGIRLSRADVRVLPHRDIHALRAALRTLPGRTVWYVTEAYFSMDGTSPDLPAIARCLADHGKAHLILDEAHSLGTFGPEGRGLSHELCPRPAATVGTFGKAFGLQGAFVAGSRLMCHWLWNRARSFVYSTALSPALAAALMTRLVWVREAEAKRKHLAKLSQVFHEALTLQVPGRCIVDNVGPITPYVVGDTGHSLRLVGDLLEQGVLTQAIRPPTVPAGSSRLRMTLHCGLTEADLDRVLRCLRNSESS